MYEKKQLFHAFTAVLPLCGFILGLTSCSNSISESEIQYPMDKRVLGTWFGIINLDEGDSLGNYRKVYRINLDEEGKGAHLSFVVDETSMPVGGIGDGMQFAYAFNYTTLADKSIKVTSTSVEEDVSDGFSFKYENGNLTADDGKQIFTLHRINETEELQMSEWNQLLGIGGATDWNINQHEMEFGPQRTSVPALTTENWQDHEDIFIYVQNGGDQDIYDAVTKNQVFGYEHHKLPWSRGANESPNLPERIWKDVWNNGKKEGNPWQLAMMQIGENSTKNGNFLAFYNKYTGILRFFFYVHESITSNGNTHWWGLQMNDKLASRSVFRYGVPFDRNIANTTAKAFLNQPDFMGQLVTPWVANNFNGSNLPLQAGWWAFDLDISVYRKDASITSLDERDNALIMNLFAKEDMQVQLKSLFEGTIDGNLNLEATYANSENGKSSELGDFIGKAKDIGMGIKDIVTSAMESDIGGSLKGIVSLGKKAAVMMGLMEEEADPNHLTGMKGSINMAMNGTMDTKGYLSAQRGINGFAGMVLKRDNFIFDANPGLGEGVWNLESAPIVYYTNAFVDWRSESFQTQKTWHDALMSYDKTATFWEAMRYTPHNNPYGNESQHGQITYFDPSSIKLALNPNVFTSEEIANAKVYAVCGVRNASKFGSTENYRKAQGLTSSEFKISGSNVNYYNRPFDEAPFDALKSSADKLGMRASTVYKAESYNGAQVGIFGRGDSDYLIEPQALHSGSGNNVMPAYEVTVTVVVPHNGKNYIYSRNYLPEYKQVSVDQLENEVKRIKDNRPTNYALDVYDQQAEHIEDIQKWTRRTLHPMNGTPYKVHVWNVTSGKKFKWSEKGTPLDLSEGSFPSLVDGDYQTEWISRAEIRDLSEAKSVANGNTTWFCEFKTHYPITPKSWTLWNAIYGNISERNPSHVILYGKKKQNDSWVMLDNEHPSIYLPTTHGSVTKGFNINQPKDMQYFRLEVLGNYGDPVLGLSEFTFNYED